MVVVEDYRRHGCQRRRGRGQTTAGTLGRWRLSLPCLTLLDRLQQATDEGSNVIRSLASVKGAAVHACMLVGENEGRFKEIPQ